MPQNVTNYIYATICSSVACVAESRDDAAAAVAKATGGRCRGDVDHLPEVLPRPANYCGRRFGDADHSTEIPLLLTSDCAVNVSEVSAVKQPSKPEEAACGHQAPAATSDEYERNKTSSTISAGGASGGSFKNGAMEATAIKL